MNTYKPYSWRVAPSPYSNAYRRAKEEIMRALADQIVDEAPDVQEYDYIDEYLRVRAWIVGPCLGGMWVATVGLSESAIFGDEVSARTYVELLA